MAMHERSSKIDRKCLDVFITAFAVTIIRSKPKNLSVQDYLTRLYESLTSHARIDVSTCDEERKSTLPTSYQLEQQLRDTKSLLDILQDENDTLKAALEVSIGVSNATAGPEELVRSAWQQTLEQDHGSEIHRQTLLRSVYLAQRIMSAGSDASPARLGNCLLNITTALPELLWIPDSDDTSECSARRANDFASYESACTACARAMLTVHHGIEVLAKNSDHGHQERLQSSIVQLYASLLELLIRHDRSMKWSKHQGTGDAAREEYSHQGTGDTAREERPHQRIGDTAREEHSHPGMLAGFLISLIDQLKPDLQSHRTLFDGYMVVIITEVGRLLFPAVFGHIRQPTVEGDIRACEDINNAIRPPQPPPESAYLIAIMKHAVRLAYLFLDRVPNNDSNESAATTTKFRLQQTLVEAIFGQDESTKSTDPRVYALQLPKSVAQTTRVMIETRETPDEWFMKEVWSAIGWDILAK